MDPATEDGERPDLRGLVEHSLRRLADACGAESRISVAVREVALGSIDDLYPVERDQIERAVPHRQREFAAGRSALRAAMGLEVVVPIGPDRCPILPTGVVGSIAHDEEIAIAAAAPEHALASLGVDLERVGAVTDDLAPIVLRAEERGSDLGLVFCVKEAVFKAWSSTGGRFLDYHDISVHFDGSTCRGRVLLDRPYDYAGSWTQAAGRWIVLVAEPNDRVAVTGA